MDEIQKGMWVRTLWDPVKAREESPLIGNHEVKVAAYCRVSTDIEKQLHSLENQVQHYTHLIRSKPNWKFVGVYFDNGTSGRNATKQKGLQRLIRHCHEGRVDFILTKNVSRFTRNAEHLIKIVEELKSEGVGVYFEEQKVDTSVEYNQFLLSTYAALAQEEIETISASTKWGYEKSLQKGKPKFVATYGYRKVTKDGQPTLEINEEQARVVRLIYDWFLQDWSIPDIKRELIRKEIPTMKGGKVWGTKNIKYMLQNPTYTGNKVARLHSTDLFTKHKTINKDDPITIENTHPAIISIDVFDRAQEKFSLDSSDNKSPRKRPAPKEPHAFQKQVICQHCGKLIRVHKRKTGNIWRCNARNAGVCEGPELQEHQLRTMMLEAFEKKFLKDENVQIGTLKKILTVANQQDHFEFHRLKWLTEMEMARTTDTDEELKEKEEAYRAFEEHIESVEEGRPYRTSTIQWLDSIQNMETFYEQVTLEHFRAWILSTSVTTETDYEVKWLDGMVTTIGSPLIKDIDSSPTEESQTTKEVTSELKILNDKGELMIEEKEQKKSSIPKREVQKIEPNNSKAILQTIEASMEGVNKQPSSLLNTKEALRTAAYCRVSTDRLEQQSSLKTQVAYYTYLIWKNQNYQFAGIYADEGISGRSMKNRDELNRLIRECERGRIDVILVKSVSRLSRDIQDTLEITRYLRQLPNPTYIYFERENIWTSDPQADLMLSIFGSIAQEESIGMGRSMAWGIRSMAKRGIIHRKRPNFGYTIDDNYRWHIVKEEASVVRRIFREVRKGVTVAQIAVDLSERKIPSPTGNLTWGARTVTNILRNVVYKGDILFQQTIAVQNGRKKNVPNEGQEPQYYIEEHHEPIIPRKKWEEVQKILDERAEEVKKKRSAPLPEINENKNETFLEKMICGECSKQVVHYVNKRPRKDGDYYSHYWVCYRAGYPHYHIHDPCDSMAFKQEYFEQHFRHLLINIYEDSTFYQKAKLAIEQMDLTLVEQVEEEQLRREVKVLNQELYEVVDESLHGQGRDTERVDQLTEKLCAMYERLAAFRDRREKVEEERKALKRFMKNLKAYIKSESKAFPSEIYTDVLKHASVYKDGSIVYHLRFGLEWTTDEVYSTFQEQCERERWAKVKAKHEAFLRGPEVAALIEYCHEPRTVKEMLAFMLERKQIGKTTLVDRVIMPLFKEGTFERFKVQGKRKNIREFVYRVKENR